MGKTRMPAPVKIQELLSVQHALSTDLFKGKEIPPIESGYRAIPFVESELDVTMGAGGALPFTDSIFRIFASIQIQIPYVFKMLSALTGRNLAWVLKTLGYSARRPWFGVPDGAQPPAALATTKIFSYIPLSWIDPFGASYEKCGVYNSMIDTSNIVFLTASAVTAVDANVASITGTHRIIALLYPADNKIVHPPVTLDVQTVNANNQQEFFQPANLLRALFNIDEDNIVLTDQDQFTIDSVPLPPTGETVVQKYNRRWLAERIGFDDALDATDVSAQGLNETDLPQGSNDIVHYIMLNNNIGDSLQPKSSIVLKPAADRPNLFSLRYEYWTQPVVDMIASMLGKPTATPTELGLSGTSAGTKWSAASKHVYPLNF